MSDMKIQIICSSPGLRRNGVAHPASAFYPAGHWTPEQLDAFRADPLFTVREVAENENTQTSDDFEIRVTAELDRRLKAKAEELQKSFDQAVSDKAQEKIDELQAEHNKAVADLNAKLDAATKVAGDQGAKAKK